MGRDAATEVSRTRPTQRARDMANDSGDSTAIERVKEPLPGNGEGGQVAGALKSKELLTSAALSALGAIAVTKVLIYYSG